MKQVLTFGEVMLRLKSPGFERFFQSPHMEATFGGGEANVAVCLSNLGIKAAFTSCIPDNHIGDACIRELNKYGVDTGFIARKGERLGIYFLETGANQRSSLVVYDRAHSAISEVNPGDIDWGRCFEESDWFHITGITPAISRKAADESLRAVSAAKTAGLTVSCDLNFRKKLWKYGVSSEEVMRKIMPFVDVAIGNEEDFQKSLGIESDGEVESGTLDLEKYKEISARAMEQFPNLRIVAITMRESVSADHNNWSAVLRSKDSFYISKKYEIRDIIDRVGGGDSFSAGLICGLNRYADHQPALDFAVAASCLKHSIPGDLALISASEAEKLMSGDGSGRVQR